MGDGPRVIAAGRDIWVTNSGANTVSRIDGRSHTVIASIHVGDDPRGVVVAGDSVWVTNNLNGTVAQIDMATNSVTSTRVHNYQRSPSLGVLLAQMWIR